MEANIANLCQSYAAKPESPECRDAKNQLNGDKAMKEFNEYFDTAMKFHGHKCPAMPLGLRAGHAAMRILGVERSKDKELFVRRKQARDMLQGAFWTAS